MLARITGLVLGSSRRSGTSRAGNAYDTTAVNVFVAGQAVVPVQMDTANDLGAGGSVLTVVPGDVVDWLVEVGTYREEANFRLVASEFPDVSESLSVLAGAAL